MDGVPGGDRVAAVDGVPGGDCSWRVCDTAGEEPLVLGEAVATTLAMDTRGKSGDWVDLSGEAPPVSVSVPPGSVSVPHTSKRDGDGMSKVSCVAPDNGECAGDSERVCNGAVDPLAACGGLDLQLAECDASGGVEPQ